LCLVLVIPILISMDCSKDRVETPTDMLNFHTGLLRTDIYIKLVCKHKKYPHIFSNHSVFFISNQCIIFPYPQSHGNT
jgi:hypothetical protein